MRYHSETDGWQGDKDAGEETEEDGDDDDTGGVLDGEHAEDEDAADQGGRADDVEGAGSVGHPIWDCSAEDGGGVEDGNDVEG